MLSQISNLVINSRKGSMLILAMVFLAFGIFMLYGLVEYGHAITEKTRLQNINDAVARGGVHAGAKAYRRSDGTRYAIIDPIEAKEKIFDLISKNQNLLSASAHIYDMYENGHTTRGKNDNYYAGVLDLRLYGYVDTVIGAKFGIPRMYYSTTTRIEVSAD